MQLQAPNCDVEIFVPACCPGESGFAIPAIFFADDTDDHSNFMLPAVIYLLLICWTFAAVALISDVFMSAIEVITSGEKEVWSIDEVTKQKKHVRVKVWNDTVANLTLMALGSSAPEIMLSVIEVLMNDYFSGMLGPSTIVGSAAFNFFMISAVCISSIPDGETRKIEGTSVYACTCSFSIFAYLWLYIVLGLWTPDKVTIPEAVITFIMFPVMVVLAYALDVDLFCRPKAAEASYKVEEEQRRAKMTIRRASQGEMTEEQLEAVSAVLRGSSDEEGMPQISIHKSLSTDDLAEIRKQLRSTTKDGGFSEHDVARLVMAKVDAQKGPKSRAYYRVKATRYGLGGKRIHDNQDHSAANEVEMLDALATDAEHFDGPVVEFVAFRFSCLESCGNIEVRVFRSDTSVPGSVKYTTRDGTGPFAPGATGAVANTGGLKNGDYEAVEGTLEFAPGEAYKDIKIPIEDDDKINLDKVFFVDLSEPRCTNGESKLLLGEIATAEVTIFDDDDPGQLDFPQPVFDVTEGEKETADVKVVRLKGGSGQVWCTYETEEIHQDSCDKGEERAENGTHFHATGGKLYFEPNQSTAMIKIPLLDTESCGKKRKFRVVLKEPDGTPNPCIFSQNSNGAEKQDGSYEHCLCYVVVSSNPTLEEKLQKMNDVITAYAEQEDDTLGASSYKEQFVAALYVGGDAEYQKNEASCFDWFMHLLTLPWKLLFALCPPSEMYGGYPCFWMSLFMIGLVTAVVGDLATHFGCALGIADEITAITIVALGTSLPDTFASKTAAQQDPAADASVGNVTGSNSVNVFLGLGLPWTMGAFYWNQQYDARADEWAARLVKVGKPETYGSEYLVTKMYPEGGFMQPAGALGYSVAVYTMFALVAVVFFIFRRKAFGGELGGPRNSATLSSIFFVLLWVGYIGLSIMGPP
jgi:solute carrier family 8 (sodium/calcium exchanger)